MGQKQPQVQQQKIDYQLHKAQQIEILNQTLEMLKNNVYGQTQVDLILFAMSEGKSEDEAIDFSVNLINKINEVNLQKMKERKAEIEEKMKIQEAKDKLDEISGELPVENIVQ